jgi:phenylpropionate dioxygenase-like ring-hydroxylating dioxygenase large terminal subunit
VYPFDSPQSFARDAWYVVAFANEVGRESLLARTALNEPVVLYRRETGEAIALEDRCIHRRMPLSLGRLRGDAIRCGYHGATFNYDGSCLAVPSNDSTPARFRVRAFPLVERGPFLWLWPGDPVRADPASIPEHGQCGFDDPAQQAEVGTRLHLDARYQLLNENLLDLSHLTDLHDGTIGTQNVAGAPIDVESTSHSVRVTRRIEGDVVTPFFQRAFGSELTRATRTQIADWYAPSLHVTRLTMESADGTERHAHNVVHAVTPETDRTTHYFWAFTRTYRRGDDEATEFIRGTISRVFGQDRAALEAIEATIVREREGGIELSLRQDAGALRARRIVAGLIDRERSRVSSERAAAEIFRKHSSSMESLS